MKYATEARRKVGTRRTGPNDAGHVVWAIGKFFFFFFFHVF